MYDEYKTKYPYIAEEQWQAVELGEGDYTDFLTEEDKATLEVEYLAKAKAEKEQAIAYIEFQLNEVEKTPSAQLIIGGAKVLQAWFFSQTGKYIGHNIMHFFVQYAELRGLRLFAMAYETPEGDKGYNLNFTYTHPNTGWKFERTMSGAGSQTVEKSWALISEY